MKAGVFGGTFDPIHIGHLITAKRVKEIRKLDKIVFVPAHISPHKKDIVSSSALHRVNMLKLAIEGYEDMEYSSLEIDRGGISYMIDTLSELRNTYSNLELIIGYDNIEKFHTWKLPDELIKTAQLVVMQRLIDKKEIVKDKYYYSAEFVKTPIIEISASELRDRIKNGLSVDFMLPPKVIKYIKENGIYK